MERTTEMKVVGGVCLAYRAYVVFVSLATMAMVRHVDMPSTGELGVLGANFTLLLAIQFVLGAFGVVASLEFFRFAQWARRGLQGLAGLHMATVVAAMGAFFYFLAVPGPGRAAEVLFRPRVGGAFASLAPAGCVCAPFPGWEVDKNAVSRGPGLNSEHGVPA